MMDRLFPVCVPLLACIATLPAAEVMQITADNWQEVAPSGKEADWIYGDFVLRNDRIVAVVANPIAERNANMTVRDVSGALIDLTFRDRPADQLSCFYPGAASYPLRSATPTVENGTAVLRCGSEERADMPSLEVEHRLGGRDAMVMVVSRFRNPHSQASEFELQDAVRADRGFTHEIDEELNMFSFQDLWWRQAYGILAIDHDLGASGRFI